MTHQVVRLAVIMLCAGIVLGGLDAHAADSAAAQARANDAGSKSPRSAASTTSAIDGAKSDVVSFDVLVSREIQKILKSKTDFAIEPQPLSEALEFISTRYQIPIVVHEADFKAVGMTPPPFVNVGRFPAGIKVADLLKQLLSNCDKPVGLRD